MGLLREVLSGPVDDLSKTISFPARVPFLAMGLAQHGHRRHSGRRNGTRQDRSDCLVSIRPLACERSPPLLYRRVPCNSAVELGERTKRVGAAHARLRNASIRLHDRGTQGRRDLSRNQSGPRAKSLRGELVRRARAHGGGAVLIMTYSAFRSYSDLLLQQQHEWGYVVLDEGHKIRNPNTGMTLAVKRVRTVHRLLLSGAPMQNNLRELWSLFDFVYPGLLGTLPLFESQFVEPINVGGYRNATRMQVQMAYRCATVLRGFIEPYLLRRLKSSVASQLPEKTEEVLFCRLTPEQRREYNRYLRSEEVERVIDGRMRSFKAIGVLRKICNHPDLLQYHLPAAMRREDYGALDRSGKMRVLDHILPQWRVQGHKALVFTQTQQMLDILETYVQKKGYSYLRMDGNTSVRSRQQLVDQFNNGARPKKATRCGQRAQMVARAVAGRFFSC